MQCPQDDGAIIISSKSLLLLMYMENIVLAQATTLTLKPRPKNRKLNPNVKILFNLETLEDNGGHLYS